MDACKIVEEIDIKNSSGYVDYYKPCWEQLKNAHAVADYKEFVDALYFLLSSIEWE